MGQVRVRHFADLQYGKLLHCQIDSSTLLVVEKLRTITKLGVWSYCSYVEG